MGTLIWLIGFLIAYVVSVVLHELAHAMTAHWVGFKVHTIRLGRGVPVKTWKWCDVQVQLCGFPASGLVEAFPLNSRGYRWKAALMIAAGPFASVVLLAGFGALFHLMEPSDLPFSDTSGLPFNDATYWLSTMMLAANAYICLLTLIPHSSQRGAERIENDARLLIRVAGVTDAQIEAGVAAGYVMRANELAEKGKPELAGRWLFRKISRHASAAPEYLHWAAAFLNERGMPEGSQRLIVRILRRPEDPARSLDDECRVIDGVVTLVLGRPFRELAGECLVAIEKMIEIFPDRVTLRGSRGSLFFEMGDYAAAELDLSACLAQSDQPIDRGISAAYLAALAQMRGNSEGVAKFDAIVRESGATHPIIDRLRKMVQNGTASS